MTLDFSPAWAGWQDLATGAATTVEVTACSLVLGCVLGLLVGIGRLAPQRRITFGICTAYLTFIRGTPLLVQLFILFFGLPQFGIILPAFACGVLGLGVYSGAYVSEIVRGSLGMPYRMAMRKVILPQAFVRMIPPLGNEFIALIKNSALVSLLTIDDLMHEGEKIISVSYRSLEVYIVIAFIYLILTSATSLVLRRTEKALRADGRV
jgi:polar amino acid transport system permease protein